MPKQITLVVPEENDATICMFEKLLLYEDQNQESTTYTKRLIVDQDFDLLIVFKPLISLGCFSSFILISFSLFLFLRLYFLFYTPQI